MPELLKITIADHIATVVMDRPPVNAQHTPFREEIIATFDGFTDRDDVRVAILTGFGTMFSAGADMKARPHTGEAGEYWAFNRYVREMFNSIHECAKPVIAAVNGPAAWSPKAVKRKSGRPRAAVVNVASGVQVFPSFVTE